MENGKKSSGWLNKTVAPNDIPKIFALHVQGALIWFFTGFIWCLYTIAIVTTENVANNAFVNNFLQPARESRILFIVIICVAVVFLFASASLAISNSSLQVEKIEEEYKEGKGRRYGWYLRACSVLSTIGLGLLIWLSGGTTSPFIPLYIIAYTMTLDKIVPTLPRRLVSFFWFMLLILPATFLGVKFQFFKFEMIRELSKPDDYLSFSNVNILGGIFISLFIPLLTAGYLRASMWFKAKNSSPPVQPTDPQSESDQLHSQSQSTQQGVEVGLSSAPTVPEDARGVEADLKPVPTDSDTRPGSPG